MLITWQTSSLPMAPPVTAAFGEINVFVGLILIFSIGMFRNLATVWATLVLIP